MSEANHYEAPRTELAKPQNGTIDFRLLAARMLELRARGGHSVGLFLRWNRKRYLFSVAYFAAMLALFAVIGIWELFFLMLGIVITLFARDYAWLRVAQKTWPFTVQMTNWHLIQKIADE